MRNTITRNHETQISSRFTRFSEVRTGNYAYVDKTYFVEQVAIQTKCYFLSRSRRFGKSLLLSTFRYLYLGRKELFEGLYIEDKWDWNKVPFKVCLKDFLYPK